MPQFTLPGFERVPVPPPRTKGVARNTELSRPPKKFGGLKDRLFLGIRLDAQAAYSARQVAWNLRNRHQLTSWPRPTSLMHVTLRHIGDFNGIPGGLVEQVREAAASVEMRPFEVAFDGVMSVRDNCIVLVGEDGVVGIRKLERALSEALETGKIREPSRSFKPLVTLMYETTPIAAEPLRQPVRWKVDEFVLIHSLLSQSKYVVLKTFPLRSA
jgi:2'-5' RNA ligase